MKKRLLITRLLQLLVVIVVISCVVWLVNLYHSTETTELSGTRIYEPTVRTDEAREVILIRVQNDILLADNVEEALENSVPVRFILDYNLEKNRGWFGSQVLGADQHSITLRYNALLEQYVIERYLVSKPDLVSVDQYPNLNSALEFLVNSQTMALLLDDPIITIDNPYQLNVRLSLDVDALPAPLRPYAFGRSAWTIDSGWQEWPVNLREASS